MVSNLANHWTYLVNSLRKANAWAHPAGFAQIGLANSLKWGRVAAPQMILMHRQG